jgi:hypothetical protein
VLHSLTRIPLRLTTGAYIANSGLQKLQADEEQAKQLHGFAANAYPMVQDMEAATFVRLLGCGELALGVALLLPVVPNRLAGVALSAFGGALLGLYWKTPGLHQPNDPRPTPDGVALAKDVWLVGIGAALAIDG